MHLKKIFLILLLIFLSADAAFSDETIRAENNAYRHNNKGLIYLSENNYYSAIKEFQIAIDLLPNSQASGAYYANLGRVYEKIGYPKLAQPYFEKALSLNVLCFEYYLYLAENYKKTGQADAKIKEFSSKKDSPLNDVMLGLLYIQNGHVTTGITILDDFCNKEEKLILTKGVRGYINSITNQS